MKEQLSIKLTNSAMTACAFTGHRELPDDFSVNRLTELIRDLITEGVNTFYCGMAKGFDLLAAETVISLREEYSHIRLILCIPFYGQEKSFSKADKARYADVCKNADEQTLLSEGYYKGCLLARNRYMAEKADALVACYRKETGGTAYTVRYFKKIKPDGKIIFV